MVYVAKKSCGCIVAAIIDHPSLRLEIANTLGEWIKRGLTIERVPDEMVRNHFNSNPCEHEKEDF